MRALVAVGALSVGFAGCRVSCFRLYPVEQESQPHPRATAGGDIDNEELLYAPSDALVDASTRWDG
mgnify:CR=1 FL=1